MFIQIVQGPCSRQKEMHRVVDGWCADMADRPGWLGGTFGFADDGAFHGVVRFETPDACHENAQRPEAAMWWAAALEHFDGEPRIHESDDVILLMDGGSDDAGFVQILQGRVLDTDLLRSMGSDQQLNSMIAQARPEIIGATFLIEEDGTFTETVAFTSEEAARRNEASPAMQGVLEQMDRSMADISFVDLHSPWFGSHA